jgi:hypothetical protein
MKNYFKSSKTNKDFDKINADIESIEKKYGVMLYARLDVSEEGILPVIAIEQLTK